jgi:hypothetical protein
MLGKIFMLLLVALGIAMAVPSSRARIIEESEPVLNKFRARLVPRRLEVMADQLESRIGRGEAFPGNFNGWLNRSFSGPAQDPWGAYYYLETGRRSFTVGSLGPDGEKGTPDDIELERDLPR